MTGHGREVRAYARLISLLRLLLLAIALAVLTFFLGEGDEARVVWNQALERLEALLGWVAVAALLLVFSVPLVRRSWQLVLHLIFDLLWVGYLIYLSGGVASPAVPMLFAVVLMANLGLPRAVPFLMPMAASLVLASIATFYLGGILPFEAERVPPDHPLVDRSRILGNLAIQVGAMFLVDLLGQTLARRVHEQRMLIGDLIEQLGEGVIAFDRRENVLYANEAAASLLGLGGAIEPGTPMREVLGTIDAPTRSATIEAPVLPGEARVARPDGSHLILHATHLRGRGGRVIGRTLLIRDETRLRHLEEDAQRTERLASMGQMAAGIAHEVRNPLASLRGCAQELGAIASDGAGGEDAAQLSRIMIREADRVGRIVEDFLRFARLRSPDPVPVPLAPLFAELGALVERRPDRPPELELTAEVSSSCPSVLADPDHLRQVLSNLLANAVDAVAKVDGPRIELLAAASDEPGLVTMTVCDNGSGMSPAQMAQAFTPFHSTKSKGTGLGLSLVQRMADEHHARVEIDSTQRAGTTIRLLWPAVAAVPEEGD